jgi:hypothetical protein
MGPNIILAMGALVVFGTFMSSSNRLMTGNTQIAEQNEYYITAISLGQALIDEAKTKAFDAVTYTTNVTIPDSLTNPVKLGPEVGETVPKPDTLFSGAPYSAAYKGYRSTFAFNDIDDYDKYQRLVNTPRAEKYTVQVKVNYAVEKDPDFLTMTRTFCKKMTVQVSSPFMPDVVTLTYAFTY